MPPLSTRRAGLPAVLAFVLVLTACTSGASDTTTTTASAPVESPSASDEVTTTAGAGAAPTAPFTEDGSASSTSTSTSSSASTTPTTSTTSTTSTTKPSSVATTIAIPDDNKPPSLEIISPTALTAYIASYDVGRKDFGTNVSLSAVVADPNRDAVTVTWSSSTQGALGTGESIVAFLSTGGYDASQPIITATATDIWGVATSVSVHIIVWIPSDS
jgi:hypothetical protein